jgi:hypothetical protein
MRFDGVHQQAPATVNHVKAINGKISYKDLKEWTRLLDDLYCIRIWVWERELDPELWDKELGRDKAHYTIQSLANIKVLEKLTFKLHKPDPLMGDQVAELYKAVDKLSI